MVYTVNGEQLTRRTLFTINNSSVALTDYQIKKTIAYKTNMQANFDDIRFTTLDGTNIPYWIESKTDSSTADIWLKIPSISTTTGAKVWMYYGNPDVSSASSGSDVFEFFDDFSGGTIDTSKWTGNTGDVTISNGIATLLSSSNVWKKVDTINTFGQEMQYTTKMKTYPDAGNFMAISFADAANSNACVNDLDVNNIRYYSRLSGAGSTVYSNSYSSAFDIYNVQRGASGTHFIKNKVEESNSPISTNIPTINLPFIFKAYSTSVDLDYVCIHKYTATEPTWAADGEEQHQRRVPQFQN